MSVMKIITAMAVLLMLSTLTVAQAAPSDSKPAVRHVPITRSSSTSGKEMYQSYCAVCHGTDAKGNGPAASAMKTPPSDLTQLAKNNGDKYPSAHVAAVIRGQAATPSHGSQDMPIWGPLFSSISQGHDAQVQQRITNLVTYLEGVQGK
jgi:mono/diheme cytochrome c family protein